jgi:hypothetical protein
MQEQIFRAGYWLGVAKARMQFYGEGEDNMVVGDLNNAINAIRGIEAAMAQFYRPPQKRILEGQKILRYLANYSNVTRRRNKEGRCESAD